MTVSIPANAMICPNPCGHEWHYIGTVCPLGANGAEVPATSAPSGLPDTDDGDWDDEGGTLAERYDLGERELDDIAERIDSEFMDDALHTAVSNALNEMDGDTELVDASGERITDIRNPELSESGYDYVSNLGPLMSLRQHLEFDASDEETDAVAAYLESAGGVDDETAWADLRSDLIDNSFDRPSVMDRIGAEHAERLSRMSKQFQPSIRPEDLDKCISGIADLAAFRRKRRQGWGELYSGGTIPALSSPSSYETPDSEEALARAWCKNNGISGEIDTMYEGKPDGGGYTHGFDFTLTNPRTGEKLSSTYSMGSAINPESITTDQIMQSLHSDARTYMDHADRNDMADSFGYEPNSREAIAVYRECKKTYDDLVRFNGGRFPELDDE